MSLVFISPQLNDANVNIKAVQQHQMLFVRIRLRQKKKLNETKPNCQLTHKNNKLYLFKNCDNHKSSKNDINKNNNLLETKK